MPDPDPKNGRAYICIISTFLFLCIVAGGGCLVAYMSLPESQSSFLLPILGFTLVCMPWIFWIVTVLYRITSRAFGFRMVVGGLYGQGSVSTKGAGGGGGGGAVSGGTNNNNNNNIDGAEILAVNAKSPPSSPTNNNDDKNGDEGGREIKRDGSSSSSNSNEASVRSHESEMPLALSMQS